MSYKNCFNFFGIITTKKKHSYSLIALSLSFYIFKNYTLHPESTQIFNQIEWSNYSHKLCNKNTTNLFHFSFILSTTCFFFLYVINHHYKFHNGVKVRTLKKKLFWCIYNWKIILHKYSTLHSQIHTRLKGCDPIFHFMGCDVENNEIYKV
jgi:hypothetical protein